MYKSEYTENENMAFPIDGESQGMTLLDYFAAHAPHDIMWNFEPHELPEKPENDGDKEAYHNELAHYNNAKAEAKRKQWPYVYAAAMMEERKKYLNVLQD